MSRPIRVAVVLVAAAGTLALGGCRGGVAAAPARGAVSPGSSAGGGAAADPLGSIESSISAIERQVDQDGTG
ncbi:MAG: hypothetical protein H0X35_00555 [Pseudonocardiales bacterium]|nr:hypothetical protein [Pseudonocardiales bacterium]